MIDFDQDDEEKDKKDEGHDALALKLLETRTVIISEGISEELARKVISQLLLLEAQDASKPIKIFVNSPGGSADSGFAIFDMLRFVKPPVITLAVGLVASAASIIFLAAKKTNRFSLPHARFLLHQPSTSLQGVASDIAITATEIIKLREKANELIASETGQSMEKVASDTNRDFWMSAEEARKYGLLVKVVERRDEIEKA